MGKLRTLFLSIFLVWICFLGACRTTQDQLYSPSYVPAGPYTALTPEVPAQPVSAESKIPFLLLTPVILAALIMVFASDRKPKKKKASSPPRRRSSAKRRNKSDV